MREWDTKSRDRGTPSETTPPAGISRRAFVRYWYRFDAGGVASRIGRTRTFPAAATLAQRMRFAFASCQHYETGYCAAWRDVARQDLDFVAHLGDYIPCLGRLACYLSDPSEETQLEFPTTSGIPRSSSVIGCTVAQPGLRGDSTGSLHARTTVPRRR